MSTAKVDKSNFRKVHAPRTPSIRTYPDRPKGVKAPAVKQKKPPLKQTTLTARPSKGGGAPKFDKAPPDVKMQRADPWRKLNGR